MVSTGGYLSTPTAIDEIQGGRVAVLFLYVSTRDDWCRSANEAAPSSGKFRATQSDSGPRRARRQRISDISATRQPMSADTSTWCLICAVVNCVVPAAGTQFVARV